MNQVRVPRQTVEECLDWAEAVLPYFTDGGDRSADGYSEDESETLCRLQMCAISEQAVTVFAQRHFEYEKPQYFDIDLDYSEGADGGTDLPEFSDGTKVDVKAVRSDDRVFAIEQSVLDSKEPKDWFLLSEIEATDLNKRGVPLKRAKPVRVNLLAIVPKRIVTSSDKSRQYDTGDWVKTDSGDALFPMKWKQGGIAFDKSMVPNVSKSDWQQEILDPWYETECERVQETMDSLGLGTI